MTEFSIFSFLMKKTIKKLLQQSKQTKTKEAAKTKNHKKEILNLKSASITYKIKISCLFEKVFLSFFRKSF